MKKNIKILLFIMLLFVSTNVKALDDMLVHSDRLEYESKNLAPITIKKANGVYAFCLDKDYRYSDTHTNYRDFRKDGYAITDISENKIRNILVKAYVDGLGTGSNIYNLSEEEFYVITQMAVWHASHGVAHNGFDVEYNSWLDANSDRRNAFKMLTATESINDYTYLKSIILDKDNYSMTLNDNGTYYISDDIKFNAPKVGKYIVSASEGACVLYDNKCTSEATIKVGESFKLKTDSAEIKEATAKIKNEKVLVNYNFSMFVPVDYYGTAFLKDNGEFNQGNVFYNPDGTKINDEDTALSPIQRMGYLIPSYDEISTTVTSKAVVQEKINVPFNDETKTVEIKICKLNDCEVESNISVRELVNDNEFGTVYSEIDSWNSKTDKSHKIEVKVDTFYRLEDILTSSAVSTYFKVTNDGEIKLCKIINKDISTAECDNVIDEDFEVKGSEIVINNCPKTKIEGPEIVIPETSNGTISTNTTSTEIEAPNTGITTGAYFIGGLVMLVGAGTVVIAKKKENM